MDNWRTFIDWAYIMNFLFQMSQTLVGNQTKDYRCSRKSQYIECAIKAVGIYQSSNRKSFLIINRKSFFPMSHKTPSRTPFICLLVLSPYLAGFSTFWTYKRIWHNRWKKVPSTFLFHMAIYVKFAESLKPIKG